MAKPGGETMKQSREKVKRAIFFFCSLGYTNKQIAGIMEMSEPAVKRIISRAKTKVAVFKELADAMVEEALFKSATGHTRKEEFVDKDGNKQEIEKYYPPQVTAQQFWLKNRKPQEWRDTRHFEFKKTLEKLDDKDLLEVAKEMGIDVKNLSPKQGPMLLAEDTKDKEEINEGNEVVEGVVTPTKERDKPETMSQERGSGDGLADSRVLEREIGYDTGSF